MSQSKLSLTDNTEKTFVIKHVFNNVRNLVVDGGAGAEISGPVEEYFGIKWKLRILNANDTHIFYYLQCLQVEQTCDWSIEVAYQLGVNNVPDFGEGTHEFSETKRELGDFLPKWNYPYICETMAVEFLVTIKRMTGIERKKMKNFDDDLAKEHSDVILKIGDQQFYVYKMYLADHSSYFTALFSGNFAESQQSEIELNGIDAQDFQDFLEVIYGYSLVKDYTLMEILKLADFFDAPCATQKCEDFLVKPSNQPLKYTFNTAVKYKLDKVKKHCVSQMNGDTNFSELSPENADDFSPADWKMLFDKISSLF